MPGIPLIFNPTAGRGRAARRLAPFLQLYQPQLNLLPTSHAGHAQQLAGDACAHNPPLIIAAGGDGTIHEVACGILSGPPPYPALGVLPIGSANDFAYSLRQHLEPTPSPSTSLLDWFHQQSTIQCDVGSVSTSQGRHSHFIESLGTGLSGRVTVASRSIRWLQGMPLYTLATLQALRSFSHQPLHLQLDGASQSHSTLLLSIMLGQREGSFRLAPQAKLDDGWFDWIHGRQISTLQALSILPRIGSNGLPSHPQIHSGRAKSIRIQAEFDLDVHTDGELLCTASHHERDLTIDILPNHLPSLLLPTRLHSSQA